MLASALSYLYVGSSDVDGDVTFYRDLLGAEVVWRVEAMGTEVAALRLGAGPLLLLADHREAPSTLAIWSVDDLDTATRALRARGWDESGHLVEVPDGPCLVLADASGNEIGLLERARPDAMERHRR